LTAVGEPLDVPKHLAREATATFFLRLPVRLSGMLCLPTAAVNRSTVATL